MKYRYIYIIYIYIVTNLSPSSLDRESPWEPLVVFGTRATAICFRSFELKMGQWTQEARWNMCAIESFVC